MHGANMKIVVKYLRHVAFNFIAVSGSGEGSEKNLAYLLVFFMLLCG
jgi:hypothetical protein